MTCINLQQHFGDRFKITWDEAYYAEHGKHGRTQDPWLMVLPCVNGEIYPFGGKRLAAYCLRRTRQKLAALSCCEIVQWGDNEATLTFDIGDFDEVAKVMLPRKRRRFTEEQKRLMSERLKDYQFKPTESGLDTPPVEIQPSRLNV